MKRLTTLLSLTCLLSIGLSACGTNLPPAQLPPATDIPAPGQPQQPNQPEPAQPNASLGLKLEGIGECEMGTQLRYELLDSGLLRYAEGESIKSRQLSASELQGLKDTVAEANLAALFAKSERVPDDAPQTMECRTVDMLSLYQKGPAQSFDRNGRQFYHSDAYRAAFQKITDHLERLSQGGTEAPPAADAARYGLPLQVKLEGECGLPDFTRYSIDADGNFSWTEEEWPTLLEGNPPVQSRQLSASEQAGLIDLLNSQQLLAAAAASAPVPEDAPQTKECRTVTVYELQANGQNQGFEGEGTRKFQHSEALLQQLEALQNQLRALSNTPS